MDNNDFSNLMFFDIDEGGNNGLIEEEISSPTSIVSSETFTGESGGSGSATTLSKKESTNRGSKESDQTKETGHRVAFRTRSKIDVMDDGFKWRKYGKKSVKNNINKRNYYKCSSEGCSVKKRVERDGDDAAYIVPNRSHLLPFNNLSKETKSFHICSSAQISNTNLFEEEDEPYLIDLGGGEIFLNKFDSVGIDSIEFLARGRNRRLLRVFVEAASSAKMKFWRERERENKEQILAPLCGQVRVLVVGDSGVGKTSLVHLINKGSSIVRPPQTIGCTVGVKHITYGSPASSSSSIQGDSERDFFVELWDVSGHERYKDCRSLFYSQINGVIFVHDLSQRRTKTSLQKWASEVAATGTFSAPLPSGGPGGLPVPYIVVGNKADIAAKEGTKGSSGNLVDAARHWVEKQGLLPSSSEDLPLFESFPGNGGLIAAAKETRYDKEALNKFFRMLIRRRYFSDELPAASPWSISPVPTSSSQRLDEITSDDDQFYKRTSFHGDPYKYNNTIPPLPAQRNLTPPPTLYPQQPVSTPDNYTIPRYSLSSVQETTNNGSARSKRMDINV
ncbi:unnamed protein product [Arabidopsis thaliana]|nr:unnamed protein product [Arabidopsis thaliana]